MKTTVEQGMMAAAAISIVALSCIPAAANGWLESRPWQFQSSADRANNVVVLDLIERKRGGFFDGFRTTVNNFNTTSIGTQINCSNGATSTGNEAANNQVANSPDVDNNSNVLSDATGNRSETSVNGAGNRRALGGRERQTARRTRARFRPGSTIPTVRLPAAPSIRERAGRA